MSIADDTADDTTPSILSIYSLAVFAVKEIANGLPASLVRFTITLVFVGSVLSGRIGWLGRAALWAAIGETRLVGFQLELFRADGADFDGKRHPAR